MYLLDTGGTGLKLRNFRCGIELRIGQLVHRQLFAPVVGDKDRIRPDRPHDLGTQRTRTAAAFDEMIFSASIKSSISGSMH